jgi:hypothetical protein
MEKKNHRNDFENDNAYVQDPITLNIVKKAHRISNRTFVVIDEDIVNHLNLDDDNAWFEQVITQNGIEFRIFRFNSDVLGNGNCIHY